MKKFNFFILLILCCTLTFAQSTKWYQPEVVEGICQPDRVNIFHRLPQSLKDSVREPVWNLSLNTAGEFVHFRTSASKITVRYILASQNYSFPHMPATGASGLDLFGLDMKGKWNWAPGTYHFGDTCIYYFQHLDLARNNKGIADFYLYLPLYNSVTWLSIGVKESDIFAFAEQETEKPIVAYGTSILQGAVATRPGLAWTNIVERDLHSTVINLGFSGNGRFEKPIFDLMSKVDARLYILDCMPNLTKGYGISDQEIKNRVIYGVNKLREKNPSVPILFAEHAVGYGPAYIDTARLKEYHNSSLLIKRIFQLLKAARVKNIYLLTEKDIGFDINSTTEGLHPNDIGMIKYADAYEKKIREIFEGSIEK